MALVGVTEPDLTVGWSGQLLVCGDQLCPSFSVCIQHGGHGRLDQNCLQKDLAVSFQSLHDRGGCSESFRWLDAALNGKPVETSSEQISRCASRCEWLELLS